MTKWIDREKDCEFELMDYPKAYGFIYEITYTDGSKYIGKKDVFDKVTLPKNRNRKKKEVFLREKRDWKHYCGSSKNSDGLTISKREIIAVANTKRALTFLEVKHLFRVAALFNDEYINSNIGGVYFDNVLDALKEELRREYR